MVDFIDEERGEYGVEPICEVLPIAPATYYEHRGWRINPERRSRRAKRDDELRVKIKAVWEANFSVTGRRRSGTSWAVKVSR